MASIHLETNIRETRGKQYIGKHLVYGIKEALAAVPKTKAMDKEGYLLGIHEWVWNELEDPQRRLLTSKWMCRLVRELSPLNVTLNHVDRQRDKTFKEALTILGSKQVTLTQKELGEVKKEEVIAAVKDRHLLSNLIPEYSSVRVENEFKPLFPKGDEKILDQCLAELLGTGTLMKDSNAKKPKEDWEKYLDPLPLPERRKAGKIVEGIQEVMRKGELFKDAMESKGLMRIDQIDQDHIQKFINGLIAQKCSESKVNKAQTYVGALCKHARRTKLIQASPVEDIKKKGLKKPKGDRQTPFMPGELIHLLKTAKDRYEEKTWTGKRGNKSWEVEVHEKTKLERKLNWYSLVFLACNGMRPSELKSVSVKSKTIGIKIFESGKTDASTRDIPICPTVRTILNDREMDFLGTIAGKADVSARIGQFIERLTGEPFRPYKFRHNWGSYQQAMGRLTAVEIAYQMGHTSPAFSFKTYAKVNTLFEGAHWNKESLGRFWDWLTQDYFTRQEVKEKDFR